MEATQDLHIKSIRKLITPAELKQQIPMTEAANDTVVTARNTVKKIMAGGDDRFIIITGPCSIHDPEIAYDYARRLKPLIDKYDDKLVILMRVYFEKPRTTVGWRGLINDPGLDGTRDVEKGIALGREILMKINEIGVPVASEVLDPVTPQYMADLISWSAIGARTTESQTHREMTSGLSMPVGFKNSTEGNLQVAIDAMISAMHEHSFLGIDQNGNTSIVETMGNKWSHIVLRGGRSGVNFHAENIKETEIAMEKAGVKPLIMVDCSHANSNKRYDLQPEVYREVLAQRVSGTSSIIGVMLESNIHEGKQSIPDDLSKLQYGVSVTDGCISWEATEELLQEAYEQL